ncbi:MAG: pilus (MSHA type) biogenesis protein MshL [Burkholderiaceae bacterium]|nr:pilus (MSHA type) biogenesis protein MshL [Burkholderiaceae bacterium]
MNPAAFHRRLLIACALLLLAACATQTPPNTALASIGQQLAAPAPRPPAAPVPAAVRQAIEQAAPVEAPASWLPEPRFDLSVVNAPAPQVFLAIASDTRYSMLLPPNLPGTITVNLKDVTVREAMESLRELYGYEYRIEGKRVFVQSQALQTRLFRVNYLSIKRQGQSDVRVSSGSLNSSSAPGAAGGALPGGGYPAGGGSGSPGAGSRSVEASRLVTTTDSDFWATMSASLSAIVGTEGGRGVVVNPMAGVIVVRALAVEQRQVEAFLRAMQISVERQVMLEAKIVEVSLRDGFQSGINWGAFDSAGRHRFSVGADTNAIGQDRTTQGSLSQLLGSGLATATGRAASGLFGLAFQTGSFQSMLQFLESQGSVHVLSNPRIATLNNQKAVLKVGTDDFFVTNVATNTVTAGATATSSPSITVQPFFSGIALDVTPQIDEHDNIILHVHPSVSVVSERNKNINLGTMGSYTLPLASSSINESDSIVRVPDGAIVAIGGLMTQEQNDSRAQIPGAGDAPVLGTLFGNRSRSFTKRELVILIKPTVIKSASDWAEELGGTRERLSGYAQRPTDDWLRRSPASQ